MTNLPNLFIPQKQTSVTDPTTLPVNWRAVERWASGIKLPSGGGGAYASLTGPGETTTPGDLHQAGGFFVDDSAGTGIYFNSTGGGFYWHSTADPTTHASGGVYIDDTGTGATGGPAGFLQIQTDGELHINSGQGSHSMAGYPVSGMYIKNTGYGNPGADGLYITNSSDGGMFITDGGKAGSPALGIFVQTQTYFGVLQGGGGNTISTGIELQANNNGTTVLMNNLGLNLSYTVFGNPSAGTYLNLGPNIATLHADVGTVYIQSNDTMVLGADLSVTTNICQLQLCQPNDFLAFFTNTGGATKRTVTGSRGGNAALTSLLTALNQYGLINNSTTA